MSNFKKEMCFRYRTSMNFLYTYFFLERVRACVPAILGEALTRYLPDPATCHFMTSNIFANGRLWVNQSIPRKAWWVSQWITLKLSFLGTSQYVAPGLVCRARNLHLPPTAASMNNRSQRSKLSRFSVGFHGGIVEDPLILWSNDDLIVKEGGRKLE